MFTRLHRAALCLALLVGAAIASHAQGASAASALVIDRAVYQAVDGAGSADVKDALSKLISGNTLTVVVGNDTLGCDPADGHVKRLHVEYTLSGKKYSQDVDEQGTLTIPDPKAIPLTGASPAPAGASLVIDRAS
ncbi:MAG: hypothetical protein P4L33_14580, partial [Capsulimonadaceae bacterium]|nr:hypothetical protein [Capsulimonadaceae bacterium]